MKRLFLYTAVIISIPFFVVLFWKNDTKVRIMEIDIKYLSNINVRVKRDSSGEIHNIFLEAFEYILLIY